MICPPGALGPLTAFASADARLKTLVAARAEATITDREGRFQRHRASAYRLGAITAILDGAV